MKSRAGKILLKTLLWIAVVIAALLIAVPAILYIPPVQNFVKDFALDKVNASGQMHVSLDKLRLRFPLNLELDHLLVEDAAGDTMISAALARVDVSVMPLLRGKLSIDDIRLDDAAYNMGNADSAMCLRARINSLSASGAETGFSFSDIRLDNADLDGADITMVLKDTVTAPKADTTAAKPMRIDVGRIAISNVSYRMQMLPTIDSLYAFIPRATLDKGIVDTGAKMIDVGELSVDSTSVSYLTPSSEFLASYKSPSATPEADSLRQLKPDVPTAPWTIVARKLRLTSPYALYGIAGSRPAPGLDLNRLTLSGINIAVDSFYNRGSHITVPIRELRASERCGLQVKASGLFRMDSTAMHIRDIDISTLFSHLKASGTMGLGNLATDKSLPIQLNASAVIGITDVLQAYPALRPTLRDIPLSQGLELNADIDGTAGQLNVYNIDANLPRMLQLQAQGQIDNPFDFKRMSGSVEIDGKLTDVRPVKPIILPGNLAKQINIPVTTINGVVDYSPGLIDGTLQLKVPGGDIAADAHWQQRAEGYTAQIKANTFPLQSIMPSLGIADISAAMNINGNGYDPAKESTHATAGIDISSITYNGHRLSDITLDAKLDTCVLTANIVSANPAANIDADLSAHFRGKELIWDLTGALRNLDLQALGLSKSGMGGRMNLATTGSFDTGRGYIDANLSASNLVWDIADTRFTAPKLDVTFSADSTTAATLVSEDLHLKLDAPCPLDTLLSDITATSALLDTALARKNLNVTALQHTLPPLKATLTAGGTNPVSRYLADNNNIRFRSLNVDMSNDSLINLTSSLTGLRMGSTRLDSIRFDAHQKDRFLVYRATVDNRPGTMDEFAHVALNGFISADKLSTMLSQKNIKDRQGFRIGLNADFDDSAVQVSFVPHKPIIAYKQWALNPDNFVSYNFLTRHIDANLKLESDSSSLNLYTEHVQHLPGEEQKQEDVILKLNNIRIEDWLSISPFAPPVKGRIDADMGFRWDTRELTGNGKIGIADLYYGRDRVGTFDLDLDIRNTSTGTLNADVALMVDGQKVITATGALNDSTARNPFLLDFSMIHFPLRVVNPFLPKNIAQLSGMLNGQMEITGDMANPIFNGTIDFDSTAVTVGMTGATYRFAETPIPVDSNIVRFNSYTISGLNENPLYINGTVNARKLSDIAIDLNLKASDMMIVNSNRPRGADIYGKAFIDLDATAKGSMEFMAVDADLNVLPGTNVTYVLTSAQSGAITGQKETQMVRFVQFSDTTQTADADSIAKNPMALKLDAHLTISEGSTINVDLSPDGKNKASLQGNGSFTYTMTPMNDGRLTGRLNIDKGFARYAVPVIGEKNFTFQPGSYVAFTGDMLNPSLNIKAIDKLKANVTQSGQNSRIVNFNVLLNITNTLSNLNVAFDLQTNDDITIENELATMSPEQRANQAMNLLLYNTYTGPGTKASANLSGNPLFSFLASQVNSWAANNIRGVDVSFGIDQYKSTTDGVKSTTTSYSYRVSKSLFNDRFKIVVGGNYSTDADADENFSQNLINDISFEYMLNRSGSMYIRLFRHVGFESILEGEVTQTGVGFVLKRKLNSLRDLFRFSTPKKEEDDKP